MSDKKATALTRAFLMDIASMVTVALIGNVISAARSGIVWVPGGRGNVLNALLLDVVPVERAAEPLAFSLILGAHAAITIFLWRDLWRRHFRRV